MMKDFSRFVAIAGYPVDNEVVKKQEEVVNSNAMTAEAYHKRAWEILAEHREKVLERATRPVEVDQYGQQRSIAEEKKAETWESAAVSVYDSKNINLEDYE